MAKATDEQIAAMKAEHGEVYELSVDGFFGYLKKPNRKQLSYASAVASKDPLKFGEVILNGCWIGGDEIIKTDDTLFFSANQVLSTIIEIKQAEIVKL